jgi:superfamily II DNA or RNA helicase
MEIARESIPTPGQIVRIRQRHYLVEEVVPPQSDQDCTLVRMACVDDDAQGQPLDVLWEAEVDPQILTGEAWGDLARRGFDSPHLFSAFLHTLRWNCVTATDPKLFQAPFRAGIQINAYQLEPLRKALLLPRVNLFIADDVGLGKTIEAGLIARELLLRKKVRTIVVACPPSMLYQWKDELEIRFGLTFEILDREYITRVRQERGYSINPWTTHTRFLVSQRLLIDEAYTSTMRDWLGEFLPGSLLILDEAHHAAPSSGSKYAIDSQITKAVRDLAHRFEHRLFLSATPHNGHSNSFSALLELLDPQRFCRGVPVKGKKTLEAVMVRRLKEDIREVTGGFPKRVVKQVDITGLPLDAPELRLSELLDQYRQLVEHRMSGETKRRQAAAGILISGLQHRLLSSIEAFARTLSVHRKTAERHWQEALAADPVEDASQDRLDLLGEGVERDDDRASLSEKELHAEEEIQLEAASALMAGSKGKRDDQDLIERERSLLAQMTAIAESARHQPDARVIKLLEWMRDNLCPAIRVPGQLVTPGASQKWSDLRVILFTEWDDTKRYLKEQLEEAMAGTDRADDRIEVYHGPTPVAKRKDIQQNFNADPKKHPLRILIATDAAREGLNLQSHCWNLFHIDLPWNPSRLEQRNGRIDRKLQPSKEVYCHYFVYEQRVEDRVLRALVRKTENIKKELGSLSQVVESRVADMLKGGIRRDQAADLEKSIEQADIEADHKRTLEEELEEARERQDELRESVEKLRDRLEEAQKWIGLDEDHFRAAISCSLEMLNAPPIQQCPPHPDATDSVSRFSFPPLDQRTGASTGWADTMDTLREPRKRDQKPWEWRRDSPIRPVVFEDTGTIDDSVVHLHLEHRIVQRLLGRFMAQGFLHDDLSRACLAHTTDSLPRVLLLGRLCLYGPSAARLHEVLFPIAARWIDPSQRKSPLVPFAREAEGKTMDLLEEALMPHQGRTVPEAIQRRLKESAQTDIAELLPQLEKRAAEQAQEARALLEKRGQAEAKAMREVLEEQRKRIEATVVRHRDPSQPILVGLAEDERRQLEANRRHWDKRLAAIDRELEVEPARIQDLYRIQATRVEPVGLAYLWPVTG